MKDKDKGRWNGAGIFWRRAYGKDTTASGKFGAASLHSLHPPPLPIPISRQTKNPKKNLLKTHQNPSSCSPEPVLSLFCLLPTCPRTAAFPFVKNKKTKPAAIPATRHLSSPESAVSSASASSSLVHFCRLPSASTEHPSWPFKEPSPSPRVADFVLKVHSLLQPSSPSHQFDSHRKSISSGPRAGLKPVIAV